MTRKGRSLLVVFGLSIVLASGAQANALDSSESFGQAPTYPPGDSAVTWGRVDPPGKGPGYATTILSIVSENHQTNSFAWPLFVFQRVTDNPQATQSSSNSTGTSVFQYSNGSGSPWSAASHVEVHLGEDWYDQLAPPNPNANGTMIGYNAELNRRSPHGRMIGLELNANAETQDHQRPFYPPDVGIDMQGTYRQGIDLHGNSIARAGDVSGRKFFLAPGVFIDYEKGRICLHRGGRIIRRF